MLKAATPIFVCFLLNLAHTQKKEYTEELYKNDLHDPDNHNGVITHLESDILECEWALESITMNKASGGDGIPVELFQILKDDAVKVLHSLCPQIWKTQQWPQDWRRSVFIPTPKKGNAKECSNYRTIALILPARRKRGKGREREGGRWSLHFSLLLCVCQLIRMKKLLIKVLGYFKDMGLKKHSSTLI